VSRCHHRRRRCRRRATRCDDVISLFGGFPALVGGRSVKLRVCCWGRFCSFGAIARENGNTERARTCPSSSTSLRLRLLLVPPPLPPPLAHSLSCASVISRDISLVEPPPPPPLSRLRPAPISIPLSSRALTPFVWCFVALSSRPAALALSLALDGRDIRLIARRARWRFDRRRGRVCRCRVLSGSSEHRRW